MDGRALHKISVNTFHVSVITMIFYLSDMADLGKSLECLDR